jgi:chitin disaccharide deacetylase
LKALIVNADDYGFSPGVTRGILEAHESGIVTSASVLVDTPGSEDAARLARRAPGMSFGLHAELPRELAEARGPDAAERCHAELERQLARFELLMGRRPTHLDSHHNIHRHPVLLPAFLEVAARHRLPLREHSAARYFSKFYGQWGGQTHLEQIGVASLAHLLATAVSPGLTELSCHPGHPDLATGYFLEREVELRTLTDPRLREVIARLEIALVSYDDYPRLTG